MTALTDSRPRLRLLLLLLWLLPDREADAFAVVTLEDGLGVVLMTRLAFVVDGSVVERIVGALRMKEGSVGLARVVCLGARMRDGI